LLICTEPANQRSNRLDWQALAVQARAMQVEARNAEACRHRNGLLRRFEELIRPCCVDEIASNITGHRGERGSG
jgi:hypothetical protein